MSFSIASARPSGSSGFKRVHAIAQTTTTTTTEPDEEESIEEIRLDKLPAAITAMRENAADDRLLAAGDLFCD